MSFCKLLNLVTHWFILNYNIVEILVYFLLTR